MLITERTVAGSKYVVMDEEDGIIMWRKGMRKRYVACNRPSDQVEDFDEAVALLRRQADRACGETLA